MKILITPSKEVKEISGNVTNKELLFEDEYNLLVRNLQKYTVEDLMELYKVKENIAKDNYLYWKNINKGRYPAIELFNGLMYRNIGVESLSKAETNYLNDNLRIVTPLYGALKALDGINIHRLDFSKNFKLDNGEKIISFWKEKISDYLLQEDETFINLLSDEFLKVLTKDMINKLTNVKFKEIKDGNVKMHSTISKKGRGLFVRYLAKNNVTSIEEAKKFNYDNYIFAEKESTEKELVFLKMVN